MFQKNSLVFTPLGLNREVIIQFPRKSRSLLVCKKCKKNYKSREICRNNSRHTALPWSTVYLCIIISESCLNDNASTGEKEFATDGELHGRVIEGQNFQMKNNSSSSSFPVCKYCKQKNYTRSYCRNQKQHLHLPWNTDYVVLSKGTKPVPSSKDDALFERSTPNATMKCKTDTCNKEKEATVGDKQDDINIIDESRTFLLAVSCYSSTFQWLQTNEKAFKDSLLSPTSEPFITDQEMGSAIGDNVSSLRSGINSSSTVHHYRPTSDPQYHADFPGHYDQSKSLVNYPPQVNYSVEFPGSTNAYNSDEYRRCNTYKYYTSNMNNMPPRHGFYNYQNDSSQHNYCQEIPPASEQYAGGNTYYDYSNYQHFDQQSNSYYYPPTNDHYSSTYYNPRAGF